MRLEAEAKGAEWELAAQTLGDALGRGLGPTEQAKLTWATVGMASRSKRGRSRAFVAARPAAKKKQTAQKAIQ